MPFSASQQQVLDTIETDLHTHDPGLAAQFTTFGDGPACPPSPWKLSGPKGRPGRPRRWLSWLRAAARRAPQAS